MLHRVPTPLSLVALFFFSGGMIFNFFQQVESIDIVLVLYDVNMQNQQTYQTLCSEIEVMLHSNIGSTASEQKLHGI